ncbi:MAG: GNAT family N-acetyltransferase [Parcubacteria group bacterium]|nr:GNAT family N-acetyltransferase [Parcubacteria group bacterium]
MIYKEITTEMLKELERKMQSEKSLLGGQLGFESLQKALQENRAVCIAKGAEIIAFGALWPRENCIELGSLWVATNHRNQKLGSQTFNSLVGMVPVGSVFFLITHEPAVVHLATKHGMIEASAGNWTEVVPWSASCGPCDRLCENQKITCPFRAVSLECRMFLKK